MDCIVHGVAKSRTRLSGFYFTSLQGTDCAAAGRQSNYAALAVPCLTGSPALTGMADRERSLTGCDGQGAGSRGVYVVANGRISFFLKAELYSIVCIYIFCI